MVESEHIVGLRFGLDNTWLRSK